MAFCSNCGHKLADGAKFCDDCGCRVGSVASESKRETESERKSFYEGEVHKCPQCGEVLNSFTGNCPSCGYELRGAKTVNSVQKLTEQLAALEMKREEQSWKNLIQQKLNGKKLNPVDEAKINLIQNFTIPTTKEDIQEFLIFAEANKNIVPHGSATEQVAQKAIAEAWQAKYEQAYEKAKILLKNDDYFKEKISEELRVKRRNRLLAWIIPVACVIFLGLLALFAVSAENMEERKKHEANPDGIRIGLCDEDLVGQQYDDVILLLQSKGFINVEGKGMGDLITGWITKEGTVESVSINGDIDFEDSDRFDYDVIIVVKYHSFK